MPKVILAAKARHNYQLRFLEKELESTFEGLNFKMSLCRVLPHNFVQVTVSGEDEGVILNYLSGEIGLSPTDSDQLQKHAMTKGFVVHFTKNSANATLELGLSSLESLTGIIPIQTIQAQLVDGRKVALQKIADLYGIRDDFPLFVTASNDENKTCVEVVFAEKQLELYRDWTDSLLDRLFVLGASAAEVERAISACQMSRDVVDIETLGLFEHAIVCKLGTDAKGLIPKIGQRLGKAGLSMFSPRKLLAFLED